MENYSSIDEFIYKNRREPIGSEYRQLYSMLFEKYINNLNDAEKQMALKNDRIAREFRQNEIKSRIAESVKRLRQILSTYQDIIDVGCYERWGSYQIYVDVNCRREENLYKFRKNIPNYFEGWYVKLFPVTIFQTLLFHIKNIFHNKK